MKKIAIKYGLIIAGIAAAWVIIAHMLVPNLQSIVHTLGTPVFFNILLFIGIFLGISEFRRNAGDEATFKRSLKAGVWISFVYAITTALFFVGVLYFMGTKWIEGEPGAQQLPMRLVAVQAFLGLFLGSMLFGLGYSTLIAFFLSKRLPKSA
jgi:polyferredoxin